MEIWKDIPGYIGLYQASNFGRIRSAPGKTTSSKLHKNRVWGIRVLRTKASKKGRGDLRVSLWKDGKEETKLVSRLVALAWCPGFVDGLTVNHKDGNYLNNTPKNLEWITRGENIRHGFNSGLYSSIQRSVRLIDAQGSYIDFISMSEASKYLGHSAGYISNAMAKGNVIRDVYGEIFTVLF